MDAPPATFLHAGTTVPQNLFQNTLFCAAAHFFVCGKEQHPGTLLVLSARGVWSVHAPAELERDLLQLESETHYCQF